MDRAGAETMMMNCLSSQDLKWIDSLHSYSHIGRVHMRDQTEKEDCEMVGRFSYVDVGC